MKKEETLTLEEVKRILYLCQVANNNKEILVSELAKELSVKKTTLTQFLLDNSLCVNCSNSNKGLLVHSVFSSPEENPYTQQWLDKTIRDWSKTLYMSQWNCYGQLEEFYLSIDTQTNQPSNSQNYGLWRNTQSKIDSLIEGRHYHKGIGSVDMWSGTTIPYAVSIKQMHNLIEDGWTLKGTLPDEIKSIVKQKGE